MARDDFSTPTKRALAERAGFRCSYPECPAVTIGPSDEGEKATAKTGEAAHISAASSGRGARRYDPSMSSEQRSSIENGIWCCNRHATLIDTDETTYTVKMLKHWKILAEKRAQLRQAYGDQLSPHMSDLVELGFAPAKAPISYTPKLSENIGDAVKYSWLADICGKEVAHILRDFLIEHSRNAFCHGGAQMVNIEFHPNSVEISDDGGEFSVFKLQSGASRGGGKALRELLNTKELGLLSSQRTEEGMNVVHIPFVLDPFNLPAVNPCAVAVSYDMFTTGNLDLARFVTCDRAFVVTPNYMSYSDGPLFENFLKKVVDKHPNLVLIMPNTSASVIAHFRELFPNTNVETW